MNNYTRETFNCVYTSSQFVDRVQDLTFVALCPQYIHLILCINVTTLISYELLGLGLLHKILAGGGSL